MRQGGFSVDLRIPAECNTPETFQKEYFAKLKAKVFDDAFKLCDQICKTEPWSAFDRDERKALESRLVMAAEELISNSVYYAMLRLDSESKAAIMHPGFLYSQIMHEALPRELEFDEMERIKNSKIATANQALEKCLMDPGAYDRTGNFTVKWNDDQVSVTIVDSGKFPTFKNELAAERARFEDPNNNVHRRGLVIVVDLYDRYEQDSLTGAITFSCSAGGIKEKIAKQRRDAAAKKAVEANDANAKVA
jgi:hypothetical protein